MTEHELGEIRKEGALRVAVVAAESGASGGAERFYSALTDALAGIGHQVELIALPAPEPNFEAICANYKQFSELDLSGFDVVISTKAPTYAVCHPNHVVYLVHTIRAFDDMFESLFAPIDRAMAERRSELHQMDFKALCGVRKIFSIGHEVTDRLYKWRGLGSEVLHPPLAASGFRDDGIGDYFFMPGRLHPWKRVALAIEAVKASKKPMKLLISGTGEEEKTLRKLAAGDSRIQFLGHIDDNELVSLYAGALAIPFVSVREDYGYVTLEAFASGKPVLTKGKIDHRFATTTECQTCCSPMMLVTQRHRDFSQSVAQPMIAKRLARPIKCTHVMTPKILSQVMIEA